MREDQVEAAVRESLERHAREADVDVPVAERARAATDRGPGAGRLLLAAAAVVAVVAGGVAIAQTGGGSGDNGPSRPKQPPTAADAPIDWRTEAWRGVEVKVPPAWGWGGAPVDDGGSPLDCGVGPARTVGGQPAPNAAVPYVGRSVYLTDACAPVDRAQPEAPYVWLDAPLEKGTVRRGDYTEETIEVGGTTVTVATADPELRAQILATAKARPADAECASEMSAPPSAALPAEGLGASRSMLVCAYDNDEGEWQLASSMALGEEAANSFRREFDRAPSATCQPTEPRELVLIRIAGDDNLGSGQLEQLWVVRLGDCSSVTLAGKSVTKRLTRSNVAPWAVRSVPVTLTGPTDYDPALNGFFIGLLG
jgi:hypothetical protein